MDFAKEMVDDHAPAHWRGLAFTVDKGESRKGRPQCHVQYARPNLYRICLRGQALLLVRVRYGFSGVEWIRAGISAEPLGLLPAQRADLARGLGGDLRRWAHHYWKQLIDAPSGCLHPGDWTLEVGVSVGAGRLSWPNLIPGYSARPIRGLANAGASPDRGTLAFDLNGSHDTLLLRPFSPPDAARVKSFRKLAREGALPPLLLWFVSPMDAFVLLDGHDRLQAAQLEGVQPPALILSSEREVGMRDEGAAMQSALAGIEKRLRYPLTPGQVDDINRQVLAMHSPSPRSYRTRVWPIRGGKDAWLREARALCEEKNAPGKLLEPWD